jgi:hypothetical protein
VEKYQLDNGGYGVDAATRKYMRENPGIDYSSALRTIIKEYSAANTRPTWSIYNQKDRTAEGNVRIEQLRDIVLACPRGSDGAPVPEIAVEIINNQYRELGRSAAGDFLNAAARREMNRQFSGDTAQTRKVYAAGFYDAFKKVAKMHPEVFATYCDANMNVPAIKAILRRY